MTFSSAEVIIHIFARKFVFATQLFRVEPTFVLVFFLFFSWLKFTTALWLKLHYSSMKRLNLNENVLKAETVAWPEEGHTSYTATLVVSWEAVWMLLTECEWSADFSSRPLLDSLRSSNVIFFGPSPRKHHDGVNKQTLELCGFYMIAERGFIRWDSGMLLTFLLSWGLMNVRSSKVRRIRLGPLTSWICWSLLLTSEIQRKLNTFTQKLPPFSCFLQAYMYFWV